MGSGLNLEFCATCLKIITEDDRFIKLSFAAPEEISFTQKLQFCVPEMVLENAEESFLCKPCSAALETSYTFKCMCIKTANQYKEFRGAQKYPSSNENKITNDNDDNNQVMNGSIENATDISPLPTPPETNSQIEIVNQLGSLLSDSLANCGFDFTIPTLHSNNMQMNIDSLTSVSNSSRDDKVQETSNSTVCNPREVNENIRSVSGDDKNKPTSKPVSQKSKTDAHNDKKNLLIRKKRKNEIIEKAFKRIPELQSCSPHSFVCKVIVEKQSFTEIRRRSLLKDDKNKKVTHTGNKNKSVSSGFSCSICQRKIDKRNRFNEHMCRHMNAKPFDCYKCTAKFFSRDDLIKHYRASHNSKEDFRKNESLERMAETANSLVEEFIKNKNLEIVPVKNNNIRISKSNKHKTKQVKRSKPNENVEEKNKKDRTKAIRSSSTDLYKCDKCDYFTYHKYKLRYHNVRHTGIKPFKCDKCSKTWAHSWELNRHKKEKCSKPLPKMATSLQSVKHQRARKMKLPTLSKLKQKNKRGKYYCSICNLEFSCKDHQYIHTGEKPYKCETCERFFAARSTLKKHAKTHSKNDGEVNKTATDSNICEVEERQDTELCVTKDPNERQDTELSVTKDPNELSTTQDEILEAQKSPALDKDCEEQPVVESSNEIQDTELSVTKDPNELSTTQDEILEAQKSPAFDEDCEEQPVVESSNEIQDTELSVTKDPNELSTTQDEILEAQKSPAFDEDCEEQPVVESSNEIQDTELSVTKDPNERSTKQDKILEAQKSPAFDEDCEEQPVVESSNEIQDTELSVTKDPTEPSTTQDEILEAQKSSALDEDCEEQPVQVESSNIEKSANEELKSSNEELKSSNEELKSSNEELKSSNEELVSDNNSCEISSTVNDNCLNLDDEQMPLE